MALPSIALDATVGATVFTVTHVLYSCTKWYLRKHLPSWNEIKPFNQNRMACEIALLPCRLAMFVCCLPIVLTSFSPVDTWRPSDTVRSIIACSIMAGCYCYDLLIERNDILSLIHHFMGPAMLAWIRVSFATGTSADAIMNRLLMSFVFFGAACGGSTTTCILLPMKLFKKQLSNEAIYACVSKLVWCLTVNTFLATTFGAAYMHVWFDNLMKYWGNLAFLPLLLSSFEFYLQWRWAFRFQNIQDDLWTKVQAAKALAKTDLVELVTAKYLILKSVVSVWLVCYIGVYAKVGKYATGTLL